MGRKKTRPDPPEAATATIGDRLILVLAFASSIVYFFSNPKPHRHYDYTFRVAENFLKGGIAFTEKQPLWLNEFVPFEGFYYSVFPLGAVLSMVPFALLRTLGLIPEMPSAFIAALCAGIGATFLLLIARSYEIGRTRAILMSLGVLFGTWTWTNVTMGGAWQLALGFALIGELGTIYFTVYNRKPFIAGAFFALAFGNRTEILLTAPIFLLLLNRRDAESKKIFSASRLLGGEYLSELANLGNVLRGSVRSWRLHTDLQLHPLSLDQRFWLCTDTRSAERALV